FKWRLLEQVSSRTALDDILDGAAFKGENLQTLILLLGRCRERVQLVYMDPPFNTEGSGFLYRDNYKDSCWISMMVDRLQMAKPLLSNNGSVYLHLDHNCNYLGRLLMDAVYGSENLQREVIWNTGATHDPEAGLFSFKSFSENWVRQHDTLLFYAKGDPLFNKPWKVRSEDLRDEDIGWLDLMSLAKTQPPQRLSDFQSGTMFFPSCNPS
ncbi:MAG: DNA methyltransferase, partial [bacterium]